jgi:CHASE2 domain-containing sensor protein
MPNIFVSYRREDSPASARLIYERFAKWFGDGSVFMDVEKIALGDNWRDVLSQRVARCDTMLAVIGPHWLTVKNSQGRRRLDEADDFVSWEIREALKRRKKVIPVLVDGAPLLDARELPPALAALAGLQAQTVSHARLDKDVETLIEAAGREGPIIGIAAAFRRFARMGKAAALVAALVAAVVISLAWANVFDLLGLDTRTASFTMLLGDIIFEVPLHPDLALIGIAPTANEGNALAPSRRSEYAKLIELLARAGARTVAFDIRMEEPSEFDGELARSMSAARAQGMAVTFGFQALAAGEPVMPPELVKIAHAGLTCVGTKLDQAVFGTVALLSKERVYPSLPLAAAFGHMSVDRPPPQVDALQIRSSSGNGQWVRFSFLQPVDLADADCPARAPGSAVARLIMRLSHRERLREPSRRSTLPEVLAGSIDARAFSGKHVLVGAEHPFDLLETRMDISGQRYGFEFHADVVNALLNDQAVRPMPLAAQWLMALLMISLAAAYRLWRLDKPRRWDPLVLAAACILYMAVAIMLYAKLELIADGLYHISAFIVTWWVLGMLERRWVLDKRTTA